MSPKPSRTAKKDTVSEPGARHWWLQRISALGLVPFTLWFVFAIVNHVGDSHQAATAWLAQPYIALALCVYLALLFFHAQLGLQVVVEDYVSSEKACRATLWVLKFVNIVAVAVALVSVLRIAI